MCMALAGGKPPDGPNNRFQRILEWLSFGALLVRLLTIGLFQWVAQRWIVRNPYVG